MSNTKTVEASEYNSYEAIRAAELVIAKQSEPGATRRAEMLSSGVVALEDARHCFNKGDYAHARMRALDSLSYTVGVFSPTYQAAADRGPAR